MDRLGHEFFAGGPAERGTDPVDPSIHFRAGKIRLGERRLDRPEGSRPELGRPHAGVMLGEGEHGVAGSLRVLVPSSEPLCLMLQVLLGEFSDGQGSGEIARGRVDRIARVVVSDQAGVTAMGLRAAVDAEVVTAAVEADVRLVRGLVVEVAGLSSRSLSWSGHVVSVARVVNYALRRDAAPTNVVG
jgi:hypothetical protein